MPSLSLLLLGSFIRCWGVLPVLLYYHFICERFFINFSAFCLFYFKNTKKPVYSYSTNPDRRFSSSTSQHFKMFPPFASSEGHSASGVRYESDGV